MKITKEITAKSLLDRWWMKLGAEMPDVYEFLKAVAEAEGTPFVSPGMRYITEDEAQKLRQAKAAREARRG